MPTSRKDERQAGKLTKAEEARSDAHIRTDKPFNPYCKICRLAKSRNRRSKRNALQRELDHFGHILSMDHTHMLDKEFEPGVFGYKDCFEIMDLYTRFGYGYPVKTKDVNETEKCLKDFIVAETVGQVYSDCHESIIGAVENLKIPHELSQPGVPRNNCIIENRVGDELRGIRTQLLQANFPLCLWPYAARTFSMLDNVRLREDGSSPWVMRFGEDPEFEQIPLGCMIWFKPAKTKYIPSPAEQRMVPGVFMGYRTAPGGRWGGEYICVDLFDFKGIRLDKKTRYIKFHFREHIVKKIAILPAPDGASRFRFPLKAKFTRANDTIEGIDDPKEAAKDTLS